MSERVIAPVTAEDVKRLSEIAIELDELKNRLSDDPRQQLVSIVAHLHDLAEAFDTQAGFGIYAADDIDTQEAA